MALSCIITEFLQGDANAACSRLIGGVRTSYLIDYNDIDVITVASSIVTNITVDAGKKFYEVQGDDDNTSQYNQAGELNGVAVRINQEATLKFSGVTPAKVVKANEFKGVKKVVALHVLNDGSIMTQGLELNANGDGAQASIKGGKVVPSVNSNTGEGLSDVTLVIQSQSQDVLPCSMTVAAIELLTA